MITITNIPPTLTLAENPVRFSITTNNRYTESGRAHTKVLSFQSPYTVAETFRLWWDDADGDAHDLTFTCAASPATILEFPDTYTYEDMIAMLQDNIEINNTFIVTEVEGYAQFTCRTKTTTIELWSSGTITTITNTTGILPVARKFFEIVAEIYADTGTELQLLGTMSLTPDSDEETTFDINEFLTTHLQNYTDNYQGFAHNSAETIFPHPEKTCKYKVRFLEKYLDTQLSEVNPEETAFLYAIPGGTSLTVQAWLNESEKTFQEYLEESMMFLTWQPREKTISINCFERLYFVFLTAENVQLYIDVIFDDATTQNIHHAAFACKQYTIYEFITDFFALNLHTYETAEKLITQYSISIINASESVVSETYTYIIDRTYYPYQRYYNYMNSFRLWEGKRTTGVREKNSELARTEFKGILPELHTSYHTATRQFNNSKQDVYLQNYGWLPEDWKEHLTNELLLAAEAFELFTSSLEAIQIIDTKKYIRQDDKTIHQLDFEFKKALQKHYSKIQLAPQFQCSAAVAEDVVIGGELYTAITITNNGTAAGIATVNFTFHTELEDGDFLTQDENVTWYDENGINTPIMKFKTKDITIESDGQTVFDISDIIYTHTNNLFLYINNEPAMYGITKDFYINESNQLVITNMRFSLQTSDTIILKYL